MGDVISSPSQYSEAGSSSHTVGSGNPILKVKHNIQDSSANESGFEPSWETIFEC